MKGGLAELIVSLVVVAILLWWGASQPDKEQKKKAKPNKVTQSIMEMQAKWEKKAKASEKAALLQKERRQRGAAMIIECGDVFRV